jgi:hypothetical protein
MTEREKAVKEMRSLISNHYQCFMDEIEFGDLILGTTWTDGQDFSLDYEIIATEAGPKGTVYWSHTSQEAYL